MKKFIVGNWKSNKSSQEISTWFTQFFAAAVILDIDFSKTTAVIAPSFVGLPAAHDALEATAPSAVSLAVQDLSMFPAGSYSGAINAHNLDGFNVRYAILGHSERRRYFSETSADVAKKIELAIDAGIAPIVCVDTPYVSEQAMAIPANLLEKCIVAYEPLEAIGSGKSASIAQEQKAKEIIFDAFGEVPFLYGGSVTDKNVNEYLLISDGVLVGGASLDPDTFARLIANTL